MTQGTVQALAKLLARRFDSRIATRAIYDFAGFDQPESIRWDGTPLDRFSDIVRLHSADIGLLAQAIEDQGDVALAREVRELWEASPVERRAARAVEPMYAHLALDREGPWQKLTKATTFPPSALVALGGEHGTGHRYFMERVRRAAEAHTLDAVCVDVYPGTFDRPEKKDHALAGLADAVSALGAENVAADGVAAWIADTTRERHVILLHRVVPLDDPAREWLVKYAWEVMLGVLADVKRHRRAGEPAKGTVVDLVPLSWRGGAQQMFQSCVDAVRGADDADPETVKAERLVWSTDPLTVPTRNDVFELVSTIVADPAEVDRVVRRVVPDGEPAGTQDIFEKLEEELRRTPLTLARLVS